jgi:hypothetical protein
VLIGCLALAGCAAPGVDGFTASKGVRDARAQRIKGYWGLRSDAALTARLDAAMTESDLNKAREHALVFLTGAGDLATQTRELEVARLNAADQAQAAPLLTAEQAQGQEQLAQLRRQVEQADNVESLRQALQPVRRGMEKPVSQQGRFLRALPLALFTIPSALTVAQMHHKEWRGELDANFAAAVRYTPGGSLGDELLDRYAPIIVQEWLDQTPYPPLDNRFGEVSLNDHRRPVIDPTKPAVYAYRRQVLINGHEHTQLTYTHWYPEHPKLKSFDPEAGKVEGVTLRITLDDQQKPAVFETLYNCGCYHRTYPVASLESAAQAQAGPPQKGKKFAIERNLPNKIDLIVPKVVDDSGPAGRPVIRCRAGWHAIVDVAFDQAKHAGETTCDEVYTLHRYDELERLPNSDGGVTSLFYDNGLVRDAQRIEGFFFVPIGMLSAGQPRQRGTQLIHWDQHDFDDPQLLTRALRLPEGF